jgi:hypothetical protein
LTGDIHAIVSFFFYITAIKDMAVALSKAWAKPDAGLESQSLPHSRDAAERYVNIPHSLHSA